MASIRGYDRGMNPVTGWLTVLGTTTAGAAAVCVRRAVRHLPAEVRAGTDVVTFLCLVTIRRLQADHRTPPGARVMLAMATRWVFLPVPRHGQPSVGLPIRYDGIVLALAIRYASRRLPQRVLLDAWPGSPAHLRHLTGLTHVHLGPPPRPKLRPLATRLPAGHVLGGTTTATT
jgi:hypothetical protein